MTTTHSTPRDGSSTASLDPVVAPVAPTSGRLQPLGLDEVEMTDGFWAERQRANHDGTLPHIEHWLEREGWLRNFDLAATGDLMGNRRGREFSDSEIYKYLEALAWEIGRSDDDDLEQRFRRIVDRVAKAQEPDGYIQTNFGRPGQQPRWSDLEWGHELYCMGHLFQAAVARARTRPGASDGLLEIATRAADLVVNEFGEGARETVCGHAEIEPALAELGRVTGDQRYIEQARLFVERRGHHVLKDIEWGRAYFQDDVPIRDAAALRGHAVRANYLSAGAVDVAVETGDEGLLEALAGQWSHTVDRRTYVTGGQGSHHQDEAFGEDYVLPADRAYSETCAGIGSIMFSWRLLLARGDEQYADLIERTLFNVVATSPSADGTSFFYTNTLHRREPGTEASLDEASPRAASSLRAPWFEVSCCPPNVARTMASLSALVATRDESGLQLHQFASSRIRTHLLDGGAVGLDVETDYPTSGVVRVVVTEAPDRVWTLRLRVPSWAQGATLQVISGGIPTDSPERVEPGLASIARRFEAGDVIELVLPVQPHVTAPDSRIDAVRGTVAVERGPQVLCVESVDLPDGFDDLSEVRVIRGSEPSERDGRVVIAGTVVSNAPDGWPYGRQGAQVGGSSELDIPLVPYSTWGNRGPSAMRVWIPVSDD